MRHAIALLMWASMFTTYLLGQVTNLSGTVNTYYDVTAVNTVANSVTLPSVAGLAVGDTVFLIQMKGATMNAADAATFGDVTSIGNAGKFEFNIICSITGNDIVFDRVMLAAYDPAAGLQLIPIHHYVNVNITGNVTAPAWDGNLGGVVVIAVGLHVEAVTVRVCRAWQAGVVTDSFVVAITGGGAGDGEER